MAGIHCLSHMPPKVDGTKHVAEPRYGQPQVWSTTKMSVMKTGSYTLSQSVTRITWGNLASYQGREFLEKNQVW